MQKLILLLVQIVLETNDDGVVMQINITELTEINTSQSLKKYW